MAKNPGRIVKWTDPQGEVKFGRTFNSDRPQNGKLLVYGLTKNFKDEHTKHLIDPQKLTNIGFTD